MKRWALPVAAAMSVVIGVVLLWERSQPPKSPNALLVEAAERGDVTGVSKLLSQGVDPNKSDENERWPLAVAAEAGNRDIVALLFKHGADPLQGDGHGSEVWESAAYGGHEDVIREFLRHPKMKGFQDDIAMQLVGNATNEWNPRPKDLDLALKLGFDPKGKKGDWFSPLRSAVGSKNTWEAKRYLSLGVDPSDEDPCGVTPIFEAVQFGTDETVSLLLQHGASPNVRYHSPNRAAMSKLELNEVPVLEEDYERVWCPLLVAAWYGKESTAKLLLSAGADPNFRSSTGAPLLVGFFTMPELGGIDVRARQRVLQMLIDGGADPYLADKQGKTAFDYCPKTGVFHDTILGGKSPSMRPQ